MKHHPMKALPKWWIAALVVTGLAILAVGGVLFLGTPGMDPGTWTPRTGGPAPGGRHGGGGLVLLAGGLAAWFWFRKRPGVPIDPLSDLAEAYVRGTVTRDEYRERAAVLKEVLK